MKVTALLLLSAHACLAMLTREQWNQIFDSDASTFNSDEAFETAHRKYTPKPLSRDPNALKKERRAPEHSFILQLNNCHGACYEKLMSTFGESRFSHVRHDVVQVISRPALLRSAVAEMNGAITDYFPLLPQLKYAPQTVTALSSNKCTGSVNLKLYVGPMDDAEIKEFIFLLETSNAKLGGRSTLVPAQEATAVIVEVPCAYAMATLTSIVEIPQVYWAFIRKPFKLFNRWSKSITQSGSATDEVYPIFNANITGRNRVVGVVDTGLDMTSCFFKDENRSLSFNVMNNQHRKVVYYKTFAGKTDDVVVGGGHGSHVAGIAAGKCNLRYGDFPKYDGGAYNAKIAFFDIGIDTSESLDIPNDLNSGMFAFLYNAGARVITNSWGHTNSYDYSDATEVDAFMSSHQEALILFAAGNDGEKGHGSILSPGTSKSCLTVGASISSRDSFLYFYGGKASSNYNPDNLANFSSRGFTADTRNRVKPDVVAPGHIIYSAKSTGKGECTTQPKSGTSQATPAVAAAAILVQSYFMDGWYPSGRPDPADSITPSGALMKAMLIHSGKRISHWYNEDEDKLYEINGYPSADAGYGRVTLKDVLNFAASDGPELTLIVRGTPKTSPLSPYYAEVTQGSSNTITFRTSANPGRVRITLVWTDPAGVLSGSSGIINILSLTATDTTSSTVYQPYSVPLASGRNENPVRVIDIESPEPNHDFSVTVTGTTVTSAQGYALVISSLNGITPFPYVAPNATEVENHHQTIDTTTSLVVATWILVAACAILSIVAYLIHRDNILEIRRHQEARKKKETERSRPA